MASSIRRFVFVVLASALLANAFPMDSFQEDDRSYLGDAIETAAAAADSTSQETAKRSSDLSNENESEMALRNEEQSRNKMLVQKLSNILRELKQAKLSNERTSLRDMIFNKQNNVESQNEASSMVEEPQKQEQQSKLYKGNFQKK